MYEKVPTDLNFVERENASNNSGMTTISLKKKSIESRKQGETYTFYDGPPTANGKPISAMS